MHVRPRPIVNGGNTGEVRGAGLMFLNGVPSSPLSQARLVSRVAPRTQRCQRQARGARLDPLVVATLDADRPAQLSFSQLFVVKLFALVGARQRTRRSGEPTRVAKGKSTFLHPEVSGGRDHVIPP